MTFGLEADKWGSEKYKQANNLFACLLFACLYFSYLARSASLRTKVQGERDI